MATKNKTIVALAAVAGGAFLIFKAKAEEGLPEPIPGNGEELSFSVFATNYGSAAYWSVAYWDPITKQAVWDNQWHYITDAIFFVNVHSGGRLGGFWTTEEGPASPEFTSDYFNSIDGEKYLYDITSGNIWTITN